MMTMVLREAWALWRALFVALVLGMAAAGSRADSPLTSTDFFPHYKDVTAVAHARFGDELVGFLLGNAPIDQKAAAINALGWKFEGRDYAARLVVAIARKKGRPVEQLQLQNLNAEEAFVLGYLRAMDDYLNLTAIAPAAADVRRQRPAELLAYAEQQMPESFTVAIISALVRAQENLGCETFRAVDRVTRRFPTARRDMRARAVDGINGYIDLYMKDCPKEAGTIDPGFAEMYSLAQLGRRLAIGTQAGLLIWDVETGALERHALGICRKVIAWRSSVVADCQKGLYRHDGKVLTKVWASGSGDAPSPKVRPDGTLYVFDRDRLRRLDAPGGTLSDVRRLAGVYHDAVFAADGTMWGIVFMRSIVHEANGRAESYEVKSPAYPGTDPRTFYVGADGTLWVVDFDSGFFRLDTDGRRFVPFANKPKPGSKIVIDAKRNITWLLGYQNALVRLAPLGPPRTFALPEGHYWDLLLAEDGSVWIASLEGLLQLKLTDSGHQWSRPLANPLK
jgi:hypothetical protein